ncbi:hypothetical protein M2322_003039 [Rhodoblastus acidophilus]|uniref:hypothetical protein n=1 Tax=Rhodoblastus acidophilus TaxID=1074 RepID=UPI00222559B2|nr:hypothetical protein [Rhodoblastus acidophilus]MCW2317480.1 hypothetical protein [Rhodoblastus acidophilus]
MRILIIPGLLLALAGCAMPPQHTAMNLDTNDPKFNSPECIDIRNRALTYDDRTGENIGSVQMSRQYFNREIMLRCSSAAPAAPRT